MKALKNSLVVAVALLSCILVGCKTTSRDSANFYLRFTQGFEAGHAASETKATAESALNVDLSGILPENGDEAPPSDGGS